MAIHGKEATLSINSVPYTGVLDNIDFGIEVDTASTDVFGNDWKTAIEGLAGASLDIGGLYSKTEALALFGLIGGGAVAVEHRPAGPDQIVASFNAILTGLKWGSKVSDKVTMEGSLLVTGAVAVTDDET